MQLQDRKCTMLSNLCSYKSKTWRILAASSIGYFISNQDGFIQKQAANGAARVITA